MNVVKRVVLYKRGIEKNTFTSFELMSIAILSLVLVHPLRAANGSTFSCGFLKLLYA